MLREFRRRGTDRLSTQPGEALAHIRQREDASHLRRQFVHDRPGRAPGGEQAGPGIGIKAGIAAFGNGRQIGGSLGTLLAGNGQRTQPPGLDVRQCRGQTIHHHLHLATDEVRHRRGAAAIRNVHHEYACRGLEHFHAQMRGRATAKGSVVVLARMALGQGNELGQGLCRHRRVHHHHIRHHRHLRDRLEVLDRVVRHLRVERHIDRMRTGDAHDQGISVRCGFGHHVRADIATGAGAVLHHHRLLPVLAHLVGNGTCRNVGGTTGGKWHHDADLPGGKVVCLGPRSRRQADEQRAGETAQGNQGAHEVTPGYERFQNNKSHSARIFTSTSLDSTALANTNAFSFGTRPCA